VRARLWLVRAATERQRAKACIAVFAGGKFHVVDSGPESVENLMLRGLPMSEIGGVMLTHFHSDHIGDLASFSFRPGPVAVGSRCQCTAGRGWNRLWRASIALTR
jgi:ribonuclease Z